MKKITLIFLSLLMLLTLTACGTKEADEPQTEEEVVLEPVRYSDKFLVVTKNPDIQTIADLQGHTIGYATALDQDCMDYVKEQIEKEITVDENTYVDYYYYRAVWDFTKTVDAFILAEDAHNFLIGEYWDNYHPEDYHILATYQKPYYEEEVIDSAILNDDLYNKPFAVMVDGIDGAASPDANAYLRNDVNHLMVIDPVRNHITMISFPRDSLVYNNVTGYSDKLTHHGLNGVENIKRSIGGLLDCEIPYYAQVSFSTFVNLINSMGGVRLDVPLDTHMDMDSNRNVKLPQDFTKGNQNLFGEYALALARNRKYAGIYNGDMGRLRNQALIITSMIEKITSHPRVIDLAEWGIYTLPYFVHYNFSDEQISTLIQIGKKFGKEDYTVDNYFLDGYDSYAGDSYVLRLYDESVAIAKGKFQLAMTGEIDPDNYYYNEIMTGWINKGTGTYQDGYLGESYDLHSVYGLENPNTEEVCDTVETAEGMNERTE